MPDKLIFFVDDEPMFINLLEYTFKCRNGYVTRTFNSGEDCIENMSMNPDLVVVDFFLQGSVTGLDVVKMIKTSHPQIPVVILSGNDNDEIIDEAKAAGVEKYIVKDGYFIDNLIECVSELLPVV